MTKLKLFVLIALSGMTLSASAATRREICMVNPQACQALARNDAIRANINSQKCAVLWRSVRTMREPAYSVQARKLRMQGC